MRLQQITPMDDRINHLKESLIPVKQELATYGQVYVCSADTDGALELIEDLKGRLIRRVSGGSKKAYLFEDVNGMLASILDQENVIIALHGEEVDHCQYEGESVVAIEEVVASLEGAKVRQIQSGKKHSVILTADGRTLSYGEGTFGSLGLGGTIFSAVPRLLNKLSNKNIVSIACGAYHTLALSNIGDVFSWGRGFEGQLGLLQPVESVSIPQFIPHFFKYDHKKDVKMLKKTPVHFIACGAYHSIAIDHSGNLYCWGEARYGQTGCGKQTKLPIPTIVPLMIENNPVKAKKAAGGFGHTACLCVDGSLFTWGLNIKGQLGLSDLPEHMKSSGDSVSYTSACYEPRLISHSAQKVVLPKFADIACGFCSTFAIDVNGCAWSWGGGSLGFKNKHLERGPVKLTEVVEGKKITQVFANDDQLVLFAVLQPLFFKPMLVPFRGGTEITFFGNGYTPTEKQHVRITGSGWKIEIPLEFDGRTGTFFCKLPSFDKYMKGDESCKCRVSITLDQERYYDYSKQLLIYSSKLTAHSLQPRFGSALGGTQVKICMPIDKQTLSFIETITIGFKNNDVKGEGLEDWICTEGHFQDDIITFRLPNIPDFNNQSPYFLVDVGLNGQDFTDHPQTFRFYMISDLNVTPKQGPAAGGYEILLEGKGLFDRPDKELLLHLAFTYNNQLYDCYRPAELKWNKAERNFSFQMPSIEWVIGDHQITPELLAQAYKSKIEMRFVLPQGQSLEAGLFAYIAPPPPEPPEDEKNKKDSKKDTKKAAKK